MLIKVEYDDLSKVIFSRFGNMAPFCLLKKQAFFWNHIAE
jgi:hypothetical protein